MNRLVLTATVSFLMACGAAPGPKVSSKEDAALALSALTAANNYVNSGSAARDLSLSVTKTVTGKTGKATAVITASATQGSASGSVAVTYDHFSIDEKNTFNGQMTTELAATGTGTATAASGNLTFNMTGTVTMSGTYGATLDVKNLAVTGTFAAGAGTASGSITVNGEVDVTNTADGTKQAYTFTNESFSGTVGTKI